MPWRLFLALVFVATACSVSSSVEQGATSPARQLADSDGNAIPPAPSGIATGPLAADASSALEAVWAGLGNKMEPTAVAALGDSGDVRVGWLLSDLLRFFTGAEVGDAGSDGFCAAHRYRCRWARPVPSVAHSHRLPDRLGRTGTIRVRRIQGKAIHSGRAGMAAVLRRFRCGHRLETHQLGRRVHRRPSPRYARRVSRRLYPGAR